MGSALCVGQCGFSSGCNRNEIMIKKNKIEFCRRSSVPAARGRVPAARLLRCLCTGRGQGKAAGRGRHAAPARCREQGGQPAAIPRPPPRADPSGLKEGRACSRRPVPAPAQPAARVTTPWEGRQRKRTGIRLNKWKSGDSPARSKADGEKFGNCCSQRFRIPPCSQELCARPASSGPWGEGERERR